MSPVWHTSTSSVVAPIPAATGRAQTPGGVTAGLAGRRVGVARGEDHPRGATTADLQVDPAHLDRCGRSEVGGEDAGRGHGTTVGGGHDGGVGRAVRLDPRRPTGGHETGRHGDAHG